MNTAIEDLPHRHRITVDEYYRMAEVGLLAPDARVELIEGEIIDMPPIGSSHGGVLTRLDRLLQLSVGERAAVRCQLPVRLDKRSEPQPDLALVKPRSDDYISAHPTGDEVLLLIEVSDTTFRYDRNIKAPLYARHGIPEVWIVDIKRKQLHFFRAPQGGAYRDVTSTADLGVTPIAALANTTVDLSQLFRI